MIVSRKSFFCLISFILLCPLAFANVKNMEQDDPTKVKKALLDVQHQIQKVEKKIYHSHSEEKNLVQELAHIEKEMGERSEHLSQLQEKMKRHNRTLANLQGETSRLKITNDAQQKSLAQLLQLTFQHYRAEKIRLLLSQHELSSTGRLNQYYQYFYEARANQINYLQNNIKNLQFIQSEILREQKDIAVLTQKHQSEQAQLKQNQEKRKLVLEKLAQQRLSEEEQLTELQQQEQHLTQLFKTLGKKLAATPTYAEPAQDFVKMRHHLSFPIQAAGSHLAVLPHLKSTKAKKTYIEAKTGEPVNAIYSGRVVFAEWLRGLGLLVIVDHGNGYMSLYGNNQKLYKGIGDWVKPGEMIARVGQSGGHAEPGLYFEIRKDGEAIDPASWFS